MNHRFLENLIVASVLSFGLIACSEAPQVHTQEMPSATESGGDTTPLPLSTPSASTSSEEKPASTSPVDPIDAQHSTYAAFLGMDKALVKKSFETHCPDFSSEPNFIKKSNCLFSMAFELDSQLKAWVESARNYSSDANKELSGTTPLTGWDIILFRDTIVQLTKDANTIRPRLLKVAGIYGVKFYETDLSMAYSVAKYKTGRENFLKSLSFKTGGDMDAELVDLYDSVVLLYLNKDLTSNAMTFLDFHNPFSFATDGLEVEYFGTGLGGFGTYDDLQIRFQNTK